MHSLGDWELALNDFLFNEIVWRSLDLLGVVMYLSWFLVLMGGNLSNIHVNVCMSPR